MAKEKDVTVPADQLVELLGRCSAEDLAALDAKVAAKQAEVDQLLAGHKSELESLKALRGFLAKKLGVVEPAGPKKEHWTAKKKRLAEGAAGGAPPQPNTPEAARIRRVAVARLLAARGPTAQVQIANETNIPNGSLIALLDCDWFKREPNPADARSVLYRLTEFGRREAGLTPGLPAPK